MESLPEKCCARCGFLYGLFGSKEYAVSREDAVFDPDLVRQLVSSPSKKVGSKPGEITSQAYSIRGARPNLGENVTEQTRPYCWHDTAKLACFKQVFVQAVTANKGLELPHEWDKIKQQVRQDRQKCSEYFLYHPGYTAPKHVGLWVEDDRIKRQEKQAEGISKVQAKHANRLTIATWALVFVTAVLVVVTVAPYIVPWIRSLIAGGG